MIENPTLRIRILSLLQRSRKAVRLYSSVSRVGASHLGEFADKQAVQWQETNAFLVRTLTTLLEQDGRLTKDFTGVLFKLADDLKSQYSLAEAELGAKQCALIFAAENGDFTRAAMLSAELISIKARLQARQAAHHEVMEVVEASRLQRPNHSLALSDSSSHKSKDSSSEVNLENQHTIRAESKIIPLRRAFGK